jgi:hypothetical protein
MTIILAIDPGPEESALVVLYGNGLPGDHNFIEKNDKIQWWIKELFHDYLVIESVESYGMAVGKSVFETCYWIGRFDPKCEAVLVPRRAVKLHLCGSARAKDANIRQALIDRFGPGKEKAIGKKASPGPLYGFKSHLWSALALAVTSHDLGKERLTSD